MKKKLLSAIGLMVALLPFVSKAQTYSAWGLAVNETGHMYDTISAGGDSLRFVFPNANATAWGTPKLIVYYEGNFGSWNDYMDVFDESLFYLNTVYGAHPDCAPEDSVEFQLNPNDVNLWTANNSIVFTLIPNSGPGFCSINRVRVKLVYNYCLSGPPAQFATPYTPNAFLCTTSGPVNLTGTPSGGTFSGTGVTGSTFNPSNLSPGSYMVSYTATDAQNCTTTGYLSINIKQKPVVNNNDTLYACHGTSVVLNATFGHGFKWYSDAALTNTISTASSYTTANLTQTTDFWVTAFDQTDSLHISSVDSTNFGIVDHDNLSGDDRGGIAVTKHYIYLNGDDAAVRYDLNLTPSSGVALPIRDGMFSDLRTGKLWSVWNTTLNADPANWPNIFNVDALRGLDSNLNFTNEYIYLNETIEMGNNMTQNGIFAGSGFLGLYSGNTQHWYVVDLDNGGVSDLGFLSDPEFNGSENWSDWGVLESSCSGVYSVIYRDYNDQDIHRRVLPNGPVTSIGSLVDISDMASLTYSPWNNRWYWHFEGGSSIFGGSWETLGYADAVGSSTVCSGSTEGCATKVTVNVPADVTFSVSSTTVCLSNGATALTGGAPVGGTYSGIGVGTSAAGTVFYPALAGVGTHTVNYTYTDNASGCTDVASKVINVNQCTGIEEQSALSGITIAPNPNNGNFNLTFDSEIKNISIVVMDTQGRIVFSAEESDLSSGSTKQIDISTIPSGIYFVKMTSNSRQHVQRIIVMK